MKLRPSLREELLTELTQLHQPSEGDAGLQIHG